MKQGRNWRPEDVVVIRRALAVVMILLLLIAAPLLALWLSTPVHDPRLFGEWHSSSGMIWRFHSDGHLERITPRPPPNGAEPWRHAEWRTEGDGLFIGGPVKLDPVTQVIRWLVRRKTRPVYRILEATDSGIRLRRAHLIPGLPGQGQIQTEEVLTRTPVKKN